MDDHAETQTSYLATPPSVTSTAHFSTAIPPHRKVETKSCKTISFNMDIIYHNLQHTHKLENSVAHLPWRKALADIKSGKSTRLDGHCPCRSDYKLQNIDQAARTPLESEAWSKVLDNAEMQARIRAVQMHLNTITTLPALPLAVRCCDSFQSSIAAAAIRGLHTDEIERTWIYDTGAGTCFIGYDWLTDDEKRRTFSIAPQTFSTAAGLSSTSTAVMCNVPYLGQRLVHVLKDSPPAISVKQDVMDHGVTFSYSRESGPSVSLPDGTIVYLDDSQHVPYLNGHCKSDNAWRPRKGTETSKIQSASAFMCSPCGPAPWSGAAAGIAKTPAPLMAENPTGPDLEPWSARVKPTTKPSSTRSPSAREQRELCPERQKAAQLPTFNFPRIRP